MAGNSAIQEFCVFESLFPFSSFLSDQGGKPRDQEETAEHGILPYQVNDRRQDYSVILLGICIVITCSIVKLKYI